MNPHNPRRHKDADLHGDDPHLMLEVAALTEAEKTQIRKDMRDFAAELRAAARPIRDDELAALSTSKTR